MAQFVWITGHGAHLVEAKDRDEAYRKVIANRMAAGQTVEEAEAWFEKDDSLHEIDGLINNEPYVGPLSEF